MGGHGLASAGDRLMQSFFTDPPRDDIAQLNAEDARHVLRSLRMQPGDLLAVASEGRRWEARLQVQGDQVSARLVRELPSGEPRTQVTLYQGLAKGDRMDFLVQKCSELGAVRIVPCLFSRCVARWEGAGSKLSRWRRIAREAAVQSGRSVIPRVENCLSFEALCQRLPSHGLALVPWEEGGQPMAEAIEEAPDDIALVIGPEGGIAPDEINLLAARPLTLGPRILRTETAGMAALTMLLTLRGDMA
jgi:16S rRNA (uracil1498-N3)-methyltransferase